MRQSLASKISITVVGVLVLAVLSSVMAITSAYRFEEMQVTLVSENLESVRAAEELEIALLEQRGYVASYILDRGNEIWLRQLDRHCQAFDEWLVRAGEAARSNEEREILVRLKSVHQAYTEKRDDAVALYNGGHEEQARQVLLGDVATLYQQAFSACEEFIEVNQRLVQERADNVRRQVEQITVTITMMLVLTISLGFTLLWLFFRGVILPLRQMAVELRSAAGNATDEHREARSDELRELGHYLRLLMTNVAVTRSDLERSRVQLAQADKLASVGKLAASVAHEIRNPLTSIKMWLFSLRRSVSQGDETQQKFDFVSEEIGRLENIVRNFLEFSRPPKPNLHPESVTVLLDKTLELVRYRLEGHHVSVSRTDEPSLPSVMADAEHLKQVFHNLINNACEAMPDGGTLVLRSFRARRAGQEMVAVTIADSGTGISENVKQRLFEPFFTTKEEGTGLGLCIAAAVMAQHKGLLELSGTGKDGTQWTVWIPVAEALET